MQSLTTVNDVDRTEEFHFLDDLESGETNMFGAGPFLEERFPDLEDFEIRDVLMAWMKTFSLRVEAGEVNQ